jgi:membrane protease YdiL (CAAX protease family)
MDRPWKMDALLRLLMLGCLSVGVTSLGLMAIQPYFQRQLSSADYEFFQQAAGLFPLQALGLLCLGLFVREHGVTAATAFGFRNAPARSAGRAMLIMLIVIPLSFVVMQLVALLMQKCFGIVPPEQPTVGFLKHHPPFWQTLLLGFAAVVLAPVVEELLFRGVFYTFLKQRGFPRLALWGTAVLFGIIHLNLGALIPLIGLALVWTWLYERTNNLLAPITAHVMFNAVNFFLLTADLPNWLESLVKK